MNDVESLRKAIRDLHGCEATYLASVSVKESFQGLPAWEGVVSLFILEGHPEASQCYAWSHAVDGSDKRRYVAVLKLGKVYSAADAVRVALIQEFREGS